MESIPFLSSKTLAHIPAAVQCHEQLTCKEAVQRLRYPFNSRFHCILSGLRAIKWASFHVHERSVEYSWLASDFLPATVHFHGL